MERDWDSVGNNGSLHRLLYGNAMELQCAGKRRGDRKKSWGKNIPCTFLGTDFRLSFDCGFRVLYGNDRLYRLIGPQIMKRLVGSDHRFLIPASAIMGAVILLMADTGARTFISPIILPVGAVTSLLGAPMFFYMLLKGKKIK